MRTARVTSALIGGFVATALALGPAVANADPPGNTPNDPDNGRMFCALVSKNPTPAGVRQAFAELKHSNLNTDDRVDAVAYGILHVCPEYRTQVDAVLKYG